MIKLRIHQTLAKVNPDLEVLIRIQPVQVLVESILILIRVLILIEFVIRREKKVVLWFC